MTDGPSPAPPAPKPHGRLTHWFVGISAALSLVIAAGSAYGFVAYKLAANAGGGVVIDDPDHSPAPGEDAPTGPCIDDVCNYLLLGSDSRAGLSDGAGIPQSHGVA